MVVIGIIAILSAFVVPGIKKAYSDFKIRETCDLLDTLASAKRSYYLIYNEQHGVPNGPHSNINEELLPFLSPQLMKFVDKYKGDERWGHKWRTFYLYKHLYLFYQRKQIYLHFIRQVVVFEPEWYGDSTFFDRVYYLDDMLKWFCKRGYRAKKSGNCAWISLPEDSGEDWF